MKFTRAYAALTVIAAALTLGLVAGLTPAQAAQTAPGTVISNQATATYKDASANSYTTTSNTVSTTVQNAPQLTVTTDNGASVGVNVGPVVPGSGVLAMNPDVGDTYTLTNTGNAAGDFQVTTATTGGGTGAAFTGSDSASATYVNYSVLCPGVTVLAGSPFTTIASLNTALAGCSVPVNSTATITVNYQVGFAAAVPGTIGNEVEANLTYPASTVGAQTSSNVNNTYLDVIVADSRLDMQKTSVVSGTSAAPVDTFVIRTANGGNSPAQFVLSNQIPGATPGIFITDKIPAPTALHGGTGTPLGIIAASVSASTPIAGDTATVYYSTAASPTLASDWTTIAPALGTATYIAVRLSGTTAPVGNNNASSAGSVTVGQAQVTLNFALNGPTGAGAGNPDAIRNDSSGVLGQNTSCDAAPTLTTGAGCPPNVAGSAVNAFYGNPAPVIGNGGGLEFSNTTSDAMPSGYSVFEGPNGAPTATGSYNGVVTVNNNNDFTAAPAGAAGTTGTTLSSTVSILNSVQNAGTINDTYNLAVTLVGGVTLTGATLYASDCTTALGAGSVGGTFALPVTAGSTVQYCAKYTLTTVTAFTPLNINIIATSQGLGTVNNGTWNVLLPGGFVQITKTVSVTSTGCPPGVVPPAGTVCPGGTLQYTLTYLNTAPVSSTGVGSVSQTTQAGTFVVTEDGSTAPSNWASFTNGLNAAPAGIALSTYVYTPGPGAVGATKFVDTVGGATFVLQPQATGTIVFNVTVK